MILFDEKNRLFHMTTPHTSYIIGIEKEKYLTHLYWGRKLASIRPDNAYVSGNMSFSPNPDREDKSYSLDTMPQEYPSACRSDFRGPAYGAEREDGCLAGELLYEGYEIVRGKPELSGLPATYTEEDSEAQTLFLSCRDRISGLKVILSFTVFTGLDAIARSVRFENHTGKTVTLDRALSASVDFPAQAYDLLTLPGAWARERHVERTALRSGCAAAESRRGASSHQQNPFMALMERDAGEDHGNVYGFSLVYSGNFIASAEVDSCGGVRAQIGIHPQMFSWQLADGESFQTPEAVLVFSGDGLGEMSRTYHRLYRTRLCRGTYRDQKRPILVNNWEATYFQFTEEKILEIAEEAKRLGIELMVLDDGWFGKRDDDHTSLGDWVEYREKLPHGLKGLAERVREKGLAFGLWFEPEMISVDSDLYRAHPDWAIQIPGIVPCEGRNQLILDLSRTEICDYIIQTINHVLDHAPISYVKWDMNRHMTEYYSPSLPAGRQREFGHRYMLGLYRVMEAITSAHPDILFESCSGGGGRFDPGMLYYMPQTWTSDDTDAVERIYIQYGTSMVYPVSAMGAHVSAVPNHQTGRTTPLSMRADVAMSGNFGYELDLTKFTEEEKEEVKKQVAVYKELREFVPSADLYRLKSPFEGDDASFLFLSQDKKRFFLTYFQIRGAVTYHVRHLKLKGLEEEAYYRCEETGIAYSGAELMYVGLRIDKNEGSCGFLEAYSRSWRFTRIG
ncbi:MAG TPA: alpha-galactosidase [Candidatus Fimimorpha excrementavium]|nr:alpha-galactosidase [Candidatus Fimimorpha excrementavium]